METLQSVFPVLIAMAVLATAGVLVVGVVSMFRGGNFNARHSNKLMRMRIGFQALAIVLLAIFYFLVRQ